MPNPEKRKYRSFAWLLPPFAIVCLVFARVVSDMILIFALYGRKAYFQAGLHIVKYKPRYVLSSGETLSDGLSFLGGLMEVVFWIGSTLLSSWMLAELISKLKYRKHK